MTYGYTAANFSGRMPCEYKFVLNALLFKLMIRSINKTGVELADSVVSKGRETLERAIHLIEANSDWRARVIYGDTDSVFVLLQGINN